MADATGSTPVVRRSGRSVWFGEFHLFTISSPGTSRDLSGRSGRICKVQCCQHINIICQRLCSLRCCKVGRRFQRPRSAATACVLTVTAPCVCDWRPEMLMWPRTAMWLCFQLQCHSTSQHVTAACRGLVSDSAISAISVI